MTTSSDSNSRDRAPRQYASPPSYAHELVEPSRELRPLPYGMDALEPFISRETLEYHYRRHHRAYVTKLDELTKGSEFEAMPLGLVVTRSSGPIFNNAAQVWNHDFYWSCLAPEGVREPEGDLARAIDGCFGSFALFANLFKASALAKFGSGWTWLVKTADGHLAIRNSDDADNPLLWNEMPLLVCDVWEHAYYIDYRNERAKYLEAFWQLANWDFATRAFARSAQPGTA
jgi:Fe-Mn family superoxide dismutase